MNKKIIINKKYLLGSKFKLSNLLKFLSRIKEKNFLNNKNIHSPPWKYIKKKNFNFFFLSNQKSKIIGVITIINTKYSCHLSFLYLDHKYRNLGLGKILINFFLSISKKKLLTVHVFKNDLRVLKFYKQNGFLKSTNKSFLKYNALINWRKRVEKFDSNSLKKRNLLYYIKK